MSVTRDPYEKIEPPAPMRACACCGSPAELWKYRIDDETRWFVPGCSLVEAEELNDQPCPMYELRHLDRQRKIEAVNSWNKFNDELERMRSVRAAP